MSDTETSLVDADSLSEPFPHYFQMDTRTSMALILGETGAGKSYFVRKLTANAQVRVGHNLDSCRLTDYSKGSRTYPYAL